MEFVVGKISLTFEFYSLSWRCFRSCGVGTIVYAGPALESAGPNARPRGGAPLDSGVITSSCSVNRAMTFLMKIL